MSNKELEELINKDIAQIDILLLKATNALLANDSEYEIEESLKNIIDIGLDARNIIKESGALMKKHLNKNNE